MGLVVLARAAAAWRRRQAETLATGRLDERTSSRPCCSMSAVWRRMWKSTGEVCLGDPTPLDRADPREPASSASTVTRRCGKASCWTAQLFVAARRREKQPKDSRVCCSSRTHFHDVAGQSESSRQLRINHARRGDRGNSSSSTRTGHGPRRSDCHKPHRAARVVQYPKSPRDSQWTTSHHHAAGPQPRRHRRTWRSDLSLRLGMRTPSPQSAAAGCRRLLRRGLPRGARTDLSHPRSMVFPATECRAAVLGLEPTPYRHRQHWLDDRRSSSPTVELARALVARGNFRGVSVRIRVDLIHHGKGRAPGCRRPPPAASDRMEAPSASGASWKTRRMT